MTTGAVQSIARVAKLFVDRGWSYPPPKNSREEYVFNSACALLLRLTPVEQELVLDLLARFVWVKFQGYQQLLETAMGKIEPGMIHSSPDVYILPLIHPAQNDAKSGSALVYPFRAHAPYVSALAGCQFYAYTSLRHRKRKGAPATVIFVDDFIGSGRSAQKVLHTSYRSHYIRGDKLVVCCLVAQREGIRRVRRMSVPVVYADSHLRAIREAPRAAQPAHYELVQRIANRLRIDHAYRRGYENSEALISLLRTPNNTLPIFWSRNTDEEGTPWPSPFPRL